MVEPAPEYPRSDSLAVRNLCQFLTNPNAPILGEIAKTVSSASHNIIFDSKRPLSAEAYTLSRRAYTSQHPDSPLPEAILKPKDISIDPKTGEENLSLIWEKVASTLGVKIENPFDPNRICVEDLEAAISTALDQGQKLPSTLFIQNLELLTLHAQANLRYLLNGILAHKIKFLSLSDFEKVINIGGSSQTSPLHNIFSTLTNPSTTMDGDKATIVSHSFSQAATDLLSKNSAEINLPSGIGKTTFAHILTDLGLTRYVDTQGQTNSRRYPDPLLLHDLPLIVDEAQVLSSDEKHELIKKYGKVIFLNTTDLPQSSS